MHLGIGFPIGGSGFAPSEVDFLAAGADFWLDASKAASYVASGADITAFKSLISGTSLSTKVGGTGTVTIMTDPRDGSQAFGFPTGTGWIKGADANYIAAVTGTNKPFCSIAVFELGLASGAYCLDSVRNSGNTGNGQFFLSGPHDWYFERDGAPSGPAKTATSEKIAAGLCIVVQRSSDGLTVKTSINGGAESTAAAFTTAGALSPNIVGIGVKTGSADSLGLFGMIKERVFFGADQSPTNIAAWVAALRRKWRGVDAPQVMFVGDSITTAQNASNGGMPTLLAQRMRALGANVYPVGPLAVGQTFPFCHSAASGNTCAQMNTRVLDYITGLGAVGGSAFNGGTPTPSKGLYRNVKVVFLFAGTNDQSQANYSTLLDNIYAQGTQSQPGLKIVVTTITDINGGTAAVTAFNSWLTGTKWPAFEALHPGVLLKWDAFNAAPWNATDYVDTTHPKNSGYVKLLDDPTYGMMQAVSPYLLTLQ